MSTLWEVLVANRDRAQWALIAGWLTVLVAAAASVIASRRRPPSRNGATALTALASLPLIVWLAAGAVLVAQARRDVVAALVTPGTPIDDAVVRQLAALVVMGTLGALAVPWCAWAAVVPWMRRHGSRGSNAPLLGVATTLAVPPTVALALSGSYAYSVLTGGLGRDGDAAVDSLESSHGWLSVEGHMWVLAAGLVVTCVVPFLARGASRHAAKARLAVGIGAVALGVLAYGAARPAAADAGAARSLAAGWPAHLATRAAPEELATVEPCDSYSEVGPLVLVGPAGHSVDGGPPGSVDALRRRLTEMRRARALLYPDAQDGHPLWIAARVDAPGESLEQALGAGMDAGFDPLVLVGLQVVEEPTASFGLLRLRRTCAHRIVVDDEAPRPSRWPTVRALLDSLDARELRLGAGSQRR